MHALRNYLKPISEYEVHSFPNKKVSGAKDHGKNYIKVRPPLVRHILRNRLLQFSQQTDAKKLSILDDCFLVVGYVTHFVTFLQPPAAVNY